MKIHSAFFHEFSLRFLAESSAFKAILIILVLALFPSCMEQRMSLKEAKQVTISMSRKSFVPPPRRVDDILTIFEQSKRFDARIVKEAKAFVDKAPPYTKNRATLARFYFQRGKMSRELGRYSQFLNDLRTALQYAEENGKKVSGISGREYALMLTDLGNAESDVGDLSRAVEILKKSLRVKKFGHTYYLLAWKYILVGDLEEAQRVTDEGVRFCNRLRASGESFRSVLDKERLLAGITEAKGLLAEAERHRRTVVKMMHDGLVNNQFNFPKAYLFHRYRLALNLAFQGRLVEAEYEFREALKEALDLGGANSTLIGEMAVHFGYILLLQGRLDDTEKMVRAGIQIFESVDFSHDSQVWLDAMRSLGQVSLARGDFVEAMKWFNLAIRNRQREISYGKGIARSPDVILAQLKTGHADEAMQMVSSAFNDYARSLGERHYLTAEILGLRGMAHAAMGKQEAGFKDFFKAVPVLIEKRTEISSDLLRSLRLEIIFNAYLNLIAQIHEKGEEKRFGIDAAAETFQLIEALNRNTVQRTLGENAARSPANSPELADLVRQAQDSLKQIHALEIAFSNSLGAPPELQNINATKDLKNSIESLTKARGALLDEIKKRFPKYAEFTGPKPAKLLTAQQRLRPGEALIVIYPAAVHTYVWAVPPEGEVTFAIAELGKVDIQKTASHLRKALAPEPGTFGDIPEFDLARAYELYSRLLKPVEDGWKDAKDLLVVAPGPLGQLPFSVLPTTSFRLGQERGELFANYREVPWLIRKVSITRLPSVSSFVTLRALPEGNPNRKAFAGFGDPLFDNEQLAQAESEEGRRVVKLASRGAPLHVRAIRITGKGDLDSKEISSSQLGQLNRLPDTAEEIKSIARAMGADPSQDIFLGKRASERQVKSMDLSDRRVIAFASHGLLPGDLDGLDQPAIALSAPSVTGDNEDGLLTMGEVLKLRLNADWVVLSACNTGASDGRGAEAVSGLGQAFFYAGTQAILVSMWSVETTSAKKLTTGLFRYQKDNKTLSRTKALQKSILELMDNQVLKDESTGEILASYAHPLFWAPFILVGDGR